MNTSQDTKHISSSKFQRMHTFKLIGVLLFFCIGYLAVFQDYSRRRRLGKEAVQIVQDLSDGLPDLPDELPPLPDCDDEKGPEFLEDKLPLTARQQSSHSGPNSGAGRKRPPSSKSAPVRCGFPNVSITEEIKQRFAWCEEGKLVRKDGIYAQVMKKSEPYYNFDVNEFVCILVLQYGPGGCKCTVKPRDDVVKPCDDKDYDNVKFDHRKYPFCRGKDVLMETPRRGKKHAKFNAFVKKKSSKWKNVSKEELCAQIILKYTKDGKTTYRPLVIELSKLTDVTIIGKTV